MHKYKFEVFTTECEIQLFDIKKPKADTLASHILKASKLLEKKYNFYNPNSYLSKLNSRVENELDFESKSILQELKKLYKLTNGVFDISVGSDLIKDRADKFWEIQKNRLKFNNPNTKLDLGGVIKEYAVDKAVKYLKKSKIDSALVNFGGDLFALGTKPSGESFSISIKDPNNREQKIKTILLKDQALTTSAHYERESHIIGTKSRYISATVYGERTLICGILSTSYLLDENITLPQKYSFFGL